MVSSNVLNVISISLDWLTHHVFSVDVEVYIFNCGLKVSVNIVFMFNVSFFLNKFKFVFIYCAVAN